MICSGIFGVNLASYISKLACEVQEISQVSRVLFVNKMNVTNGKKYILIFVYTTAKEI